MGYIKKRMCNSDCHVYTFKPEELRFDISIGVPGKLEKLSAMKGEPKTDETVVAKMNGGFYNTNGSAEYLGTFVDEGLYYNPSSSMYPTLVFWKTGLLAIEHNPDQKRLVDYQNTAHFAIGLPWTLVVNGKIDYTYPVATLNATFGHPSSRQPRTLVGQKADKTIVWVVVDGRRATSLGVTMQQSAQIMLELGCVTAANGDGGGSSEMEIDGRIVNRPSDGTERRIGNAFMAYQKIGNVSLGEGSIKNGSTAMATSALNFRKGPGTAYAAISLLAKGSKVTVNGYSGGWYNVTWNGTSGYVSGSYLTDVSLPAPSGHATGTVVSGGGLNVRKGPGSGYAKVKALMNGTPVTIYESKDGWYRIGVNMWVSSLYIRKKI